MSKKKVLSLGIDVGATGIKGALVDIEKGEMASDRVKIPTPEPATPAAMSRVVNDIVKELGWEKGKIGCGFPAIMKDGVCFSATNIEKNWIGTNAEEVFSKATGFPFQVINDADAAGIAEMRYGHGKNVKGTVMLITVGTGIGSALFTYGKRVENTEFGHLKWKGDIAENWVSNTARKTKGLEYDEWAGELNEFLIHLNKIFSPNLMLIGGGISKRFNDYKHMFKKSLPVKAAKLYNNAGIIGAVAAL